MAKLPDAEYLRRTFCYDEGTGTLFWRQRDDARPQWNAHYVGKVAGSTVGGRLQIILNGKNFKGHRIIWKFIYGVDPASGIDHKDGNPLNNRIDNLRLATNAENMRNISSRTISGFKGVSIHKKTGLWRARVRVNQREICEYHPTPEDAYAAYCRLAQQHYGEFARYA